MSLIQKLKNWLMGVDSKSPIVAESAPYKIETSTVAVNNVEVITKVEPKVDTVLTLPENTPEPTPTPAPAVQKSEEVPVAEKKKPRTTKVQGSNAGEVKEPKPKKPKAKKDSKVS